MQQIAAKNKLTPVDLSDTLKNLARIHEPAFVDGPPGIGKSQIMQQVAKEENYEYIDVRALLMDPVDLKGIPYLDSERRTHWGSASFLPPTNSTDKYLINLEELQAAPQAVQIALYQLILDRGIGDYRLPEGASVMACGNRRSDGGVFHPFPRALRDRFWHLHLEVDSKQWAQWAIDNDVAIEVIMFILFKPDLLYQQEEELQNEYYQEDEQEAFPTPRSWTKVSSYLKTYGPPHQSIAIQLFGGKVGPGPAREFCNFLHQWQQLADPYTIVTDPEHANIPEEISAQISTCASLYNIADDTNFPAIITYANRLPRPEIAGFLVKSCIRRNPDLKNREQWIRWIAAHS